MDAIRKKLAPKKEVPRKIQISAPNPRPDLIFGPGKIVYASPERPEDDEPWKTDPFGVPPHPSYAERTDRVGRLERTKKRDFKAALEQKNFKIIPPSDPGTTFQHTFTTLEDFEFRPEKDPPRRAPSVEEQRRRYPPTHHSNGTPILPPPAPSGYIPYDVKKALDLKRIADKKSNRRQREQEYYEELLHQMQMREAHGPPPPPTPPPKDPPKAARTEEQPEAAEPETKPEREIPRLADVLKKPDDDYHSLSAEQKKGRLPPPIQHTGRHAQLREHLAKAKAAKAASGQQPLGNSFVSNTISTPAPDPSFWVGNEEAIYRPGKPGNGSHLRSASLSHQPPAGTPPRLTKSKYGSLSRVEGSSSRRGDEENYASTPVIERAMEPTTPAPRRPRPSDPTHRRTGSRNAVFYTPEDLQHAAFNGSSWTRPRAESAGPTVAPASAPQPQPQVQQDPPSIPVASTSHVRSDSTSSTKREGVFGFPPTPPLKIHKRNPSSDSTAAPVHTVLDYAMATTSRAAARQEGPPPVMRHRELIDANRPPVIKRPGRLESLPISARSKVAKEEYFTPPPSKYDIDPIDGTRTRLDKEFGVLPQRTQSTSSATLPLKLKGTPGHGHSQSLQMDRERGLPAHPAVHLQEKKIRRVGRLNS